MKESFVVEEHQILDVAKNVIEALAQKSNTHAKVILLEGDLGAGKTTFTKALAEVLGIDRHDVHSPTFILKKTYKAEHPHFKKLIHIDAYRFETKEEARVLDLEKDLEDAATLLAIEWPSKMHAIPADMVITLDVVDDTKRIMAIDYTQHS